MSNIVRTWDANFAGEIELTDAALEAIFGAQDGTTYTPNANGGDTSTQSTSATNSRVGGILNNNGFNIPDLNANILGVELQRLGLPGLLATN